MKVRKTGKRAELNQLWAQINALQADLAEVRTQLAALGSDLGTVVGPEVGRIVDDVGSLYTSVQALTAKLDLDDGVTDADYASTCDPAAATATGDLQPTYTAPAELTSEQVELVAP